MSEMESAYQPSKHESRIYKLWEASDAFAPTTNPKAEPYTILMPPPNANGDLHLGHTLSSTIQDILIRRARMQGKAALFLPGADHAGFETQVVYERRLAADSKSRFDFKRDELYQQIWDYVQSNKHKMEDQQKRIGASVDWSRNTFTLDPQVVSTTQQTFKKMYEDGLLYRGKRIVNYCTFHGTSFSELEVEYQDVDSHLWHFRYPVQGSQEGIEVATTRPETMLGDTAVAVHPDDKRYSHLIGKLLELPLTGRTIPIVADSAVDPKFGSGAVKVTPAHDPTDFEIGERHNLPAIEVIGKNGNMTEEAGSDYAGMTPDEARIQVVHDLTKAGFHVKTEPYSHSVGHCYKCGTVIQPLVLDQWLIRMQPLAKRAIGALEKGEVTVVPTNKHKVLMQWLENLRDWNISRQIVWGIPIPAFIAESGEVIVDLKEAADQITRDNVTYTRDPDVFDTWFSSGQWPQVTLGYPDSADFKRFYPTTVMENGTDILTFWDSRMLMLGLYLTDKVPFKTIYLHGLVQDEHGKKMSKSKGNTVEPAPLLEKYGADALRMGIVAARSAGMNQGFSEKRVETYRNFANKLWNVSRFILSQLDDTTKPDPTAAKSLADHWIIERFSRENKALNRNLDKFRFSESVEQIYSLLWNDLADWYVEASKTEPNPAVLAYCLNTILRLAHPFAPFVTEAIWQKLPWKAGDLITASWPEPAGTHAAKAKQFTQLQNLIAQTRSVAAELGISKATLVSQEALIINNSELVKRLAGLGEVAKGNDGLKLEGFDAWLALTNEQQQDYRHRLEERLKETQAYINRLAKQLDNKSYLANAPKAVVEDTTARLTAAKQLVSELNEQLAAV